MSYPSGPQPYGQPFNPSYGQPQGLDAPLYGATFGQAVQRFFKKYATFSGRASRSEYWWVTLLGVVVSLITFAIDLVANGGDLAATNASTTGIGDILGYLWSLAVLVPSLAVTWRRLHDNNRSGWWYLLALVPIIGWIVLLVFLVSGPRPEGARFDKGGMPAQQYGGPAPYAGPGQY